jgi:transposase
MRRVSKAASTKKPPMRVSDSFWELVKPHIPVRTRSDSQTYRREPGGGRKPIPARKAFAAITYLLRTGSSWKSLPRSFGSSSAIHRHFDQWHEAGLFLNLWRAGLAEHEEMEGISWQWQLPDENHRQARKNTTHSASGRSLHHSDLILPRDWQPSLGRRRRRSIKRNNPHS